MKNNIKIGDGLRFYRKKRGYSQGDLAEKTGYSQKYISQVETNNKTPTLQFLDSVSIKLKVKIVQLFWASLTEKDFTPSKKDNYNILKPNIDKMFIEIFEK